MEVMESMEIHQTSVEKEEDQDPIEAEDIQRVVETLEVVQMEVREASLLMEGVSREDTLMEVVEILKKAEKETDLEVEILKEVGTNLKREKVADQEVETLREAKIILQREDVPDLEVETDQTKILHQ